MKKFLLSVVAVMSFVALSLPYQSAKADAVGECIGSFGTDVPYEVLSAAIDVCLELIQGGIY